MRLSAGMRSSILVGSGILLYYFCCVVCLYHNIIIMNVRDKNCFLFLGGFLDLSL